MTPTPMMGVEGEHGLFWLSDEQRMAIEPHLPKNQPGCAECKGDRDTPPQ
jgi:hypothetical protein